MKLLFMIIFFSSLSGCYTILYHPGSLRSESDPGLASRTNNRDDAYYIGDADMIPLVSQEELDPVDEFIEVTRTRERTDGDATSVMPVFPQVYSIGVVSSPVNLSGQDAQAEESPRDVSSPRRSFGLRKVKQINKEPDHQ